MRYFWRVSHIACSIEFPEAGIWGTLRKKQGSGGHWEIFISQNVKFLITHSIQIIVTTYANAFSLFMARLGSIATSLGKLFQKVCKFMFTMQYHTANWCHSRLMHINSTCGHDEEFLRPYKYCRATHTCSLSTKSTFAHLLHSYVVLNYNIFIVH